MQSRGPYSVEFQSLIIPQSLGLPPQLQTTSLPTNSEAEVAHPDIFCNQCYQQVIGCRYSCTVCPDYDLCSKCYKNLATFHDGSHAFDAIAKPAEASNTFHPQQRLELKFEPRPLNIPVQLEPPRSPPERVQPLPPQVHESNLSLSRSLNDFGSPLGTDLSSSIESSPLANALRDDVTEAGFLSLASSLPASPTFSLTQTEGNWQSTFHTFFQAETFGSPFTTPSPSFSTTFMPHHVPSGIPSTPSHYDPPSLIPRPKTDIT
ncbi:hypothetical protein BLNAU_15517 [Blattamonas nauphoetae]|uniref:ZZ-type domain-containing protein n=1 Tax=Blattamonas nauphoetae TaxID=2049346 RepID=A0ABQ9XDU8_9EUKA|nr:hypothetical protein BLNAU_15517 [Blattamonas nauphoetae]